MKTLSGKDAALIANSLRMAGLQWTADAATMRDADLDPRADLGAVKSDLMADHFERQARDAERLADEIDEAVCVTLTEAPSEEV